MAVVSPAYTGLPLRETRVSSGLARRMTLRLRGVVMSNFGVIRGVAMGAPRSRREVLAFRGVSMAVSRRAVTVRFRVDLRTVPVDGGGSMAPVLCAGVLPTPLAAEVGGRFLVDLCKD